MLYRAEMDFKACVDEFEDEVALFRIQYTYSHYGMHG